MTVLVTSPQVSLTPRTIGPLAAQVPFDSTHWSMTFTKGAWPAAGKVLDLVVEECADFSNPVWKFSASMDLWDMPVTGGGWTTRRMFPNSGSGVRVTVEVFQNCTLGFTVGA